MKKQFLKGLLLTLGLGSLLWANPKEQVVDCNIVFEQRKSEILRELEKIDEQQQALQALQSATQNILDQKEADLKKREAAIETAKKEIALKEENVAKMLKKNENVLKQIKTATQSKVGTTYTAMKDSKSAAILESMSSSEAAEILYGLDTKIVSKILAKMNPQKAAELTQLITKGPPFEEQEQQQ